MSNTLFNKLHKKINSNIFDLVNDLGGSFSAEHGIGLIKKPYLNYSRGEAELKYMRGVKRLFDPKNIMNPGKLVDI